MAAQAYQESTFDPKATSWAGAKGLMQIMPTTADHLGLPRDQMYDPEKSIAAAAKLIEELEHTFSDISDHRERINFMLLIMVEVTIYVTPWHFVSVMDIIITSGQMCQNMY